METEESLPYHAEDAASVILTIEYKKAVIHLNDLLKEY